MRHGRAPAAEARNDLTLPDHMYPMRWEAPSSSKGRLELDRVEW